MRRDLHEMLAVTVNLHRIWGDTDLTRAAKRIRDWSEGVKAAAYDPDRTSPPNRVDEINGVRYVIPNISDPTGEAAINTRPATPDYQAIVTRYVHAALELEQVSAELTRSSDPSLFDLKATDTADYVRPGAGVCDVCDHECTGVRVEGQAEDRLKRGCCIACYHKVRSSMARGMTEEAAKRSLRAANLDLDRVILAEDLPTGDEAA